MKRATASMIVVFLALGIWSVVETSALGQEAPEETPPWRTLYTGDECDGENVIALWQFRPGLETVDNSGNGHDLTLHGDSAFVPGGVFGSCLESVTADVKNDKKQGASCRNHPDLSPGGAFTLEAWYKANPEMADHPTSFLLDKKYYHYAKDLPKANCDYCLYLSKRPGGKYKIVAYLGFGRDSATYSSKELPFVPDQWQHVAFIYDGAGTGRFFLDGALVGRTTHEGRYGSVHTGFPGHIDQVRISRGIVPFFTGSIEVSMGGGRAAFVRMEPDCRLKVRVVNDTATPLVRARLGVSLGGLDRSVAVEPVAPGESHTISVPVDTTVKPGKYAVALTVKGTLGGKQVSVQEEQVVTIVPRPLPNTMPVVMWGGGDLPTLADVGFTHHLIHLVDYQKVWDAGTVTDAMSSGRTEELMATLDSHLAAGVAGCVYTYPGRWLAKRKELFEKFQRVDRAGVSCGHENICATFPEAKTFAYNVGASIARTFGGHPALQMSLVHSEIRDGTSLCFHDHDREACKKATGNDIPRRAVGKGGVRYSVLPTFPTDRIVPDDDRLLTFYKWFWREGDGWNGLHSDVHRGLKSTGRSDLCTFFDPAVRVPSVWGSGGKVDVVSQWTYSYPDPIKIGQATDELFAMAAGQPGQQVMKMTQIIWYRSGTAPKLPEDEAQYAPWEKEIPDARFVTISPDHMREAFWSKISRPIRGIMYHGWGSLVKSDHGGYRFTNPETRGVLTELVRDVVRPLGPTLLQVPDRPSDVAVLASFASQMYASRGTRGWSGSWEADMHLILQWAHLQPEIVFDETVLRDGLDKFRVLVMPSCDVLTASVAAKVRAFQERGGLIVSDEHLAPGITPDIMIETIRRKDPADQAKVALQAKAAALRADLDAFYARYGDASDQDTVIRFRRYASTDYLFALNDKRTFGTYVGHHGKVMEKGLPNAAEISVRRPSGHVYDLLAHQEVRVKRAGDKLTFNAAFEPGSGKVFMITERPVEELSVTAPVTATLKGTLTIDVAVLGKDGKPVDAVVPVRIAVLDPEGVAADLSGHYGAKDGRVNVTIALAPNDLVGDWTIDVQDLASGRTARRKLVVTGE